MLEHRNFYRIENMVRSPLSRVQRQGAVTRHRAALWILGKRVLPKVPLLLTEKEFEEHKELLLADVKLGKIAVVRPDQVRIDSTDDGALIYYPPGKPATRTEPPFEKAVKPASEGEDLKPEADAEVDTEEAVVPPSEAITQELPALEAGLPRMCTNCHEVPAQEGADFCGTCIVKDASPNIEELVEELAPQLESANPVPAEPQDAVAESQGEELPPPLEAVLPEAEAPLPIIPEKKIELDTTPQEETPVEVAPEPEPEVTERKPRKKKGKNHE